MYPFEDRIKFLENVLDMSDSEVKAFAIEDLIRKWKLDREDELKALKKDKKSWNLGL